MLDELNSAYLRNGFLSKPIIEKECSFTYQAAIESFGSKEKISAELGVDSAFITTSSTLSKQVYDALVIIYGKDNVVKEVTFDWLINDKSGKHMWFDFYIPTIKTAVECDGEQHFKWVKYFHKTYDDFLNSIKRDRKKEKLAIYHGIKVVRFNYLQNIDSEFVKKNINVT